MQSNTLPKKQQILIVIASTFIYLGIIVAVIAAFLHFTTPTTSATTTPTDQYMSERSGTGLQDGGLIIDGYNEIKAELQAEADASRMQYKINVNPIFKTSTSKGDLMIENAEGNPNLLQVDIVEEGTNKVLYASPTIKPNQSIQEDYLTCTDLSKGNYKAVAIFRCFDPETKRMTGEAGIRISITVQE